MGTVERRERRRRELREKILDAARELFSSSGYEAATLRKIAEKIEYSPTTIYLHFRDKHALLRELCTADFLDLASRFRLLERDRDPVRRLKGIGAAFLRFAKERPNHYRMMFMTPTPPVAVEERQIEKGNPEVDAWAFVRNAVDEAQRAGQLRDTSGGPESLAQLFFAGIHGVAALHIAKSNDPWIDWRPMDEIADRMIDTLVRGCGAPGQAAPRRPSRRLSRSSPAAKSSAERARPGKGRQR